MTNSHPQSSFPSEQDPSDIPFPRKIKQLLKKQKFAEARALLRSLGETHQRPPNSITRKLSLLVERKELQTGSENFTGSPKTRSQAQLVTKAYQLCKRNKLEKAKKLALAIHASDIRDPIILKKLHFVYRNLLDHRSAEKLSLKLHELYPSEVEYLAQLVEDSLSIANFSACKDYISRASSPSPRLLKLRAQINNTELLSEAIKDRPDNWQNLRPECDVIAIASDEAPYLADFVHHYIYLGFKHIFIGINNSTDETLAIAQKMSLAYSQVHIFNVDQSMRAFNQRGAYTELWREANTISRSTHCMFVDIDEFWVGSPFPTSISDFLMRHPGVEVLTFNWVNCFETREFTAPLDFRNVELRAKSNCKSIVSYYSKVLELRCHSPVLAAYNEIPHCIDPFGSRIYSSAGPIGFTLPTSFSVTTESIAAPELGFVFHRLTRSETEYCYRLLKPHANQVKGHLQSQKIIPFKENRFGFKNLNGNELPSEFMANLFPDESITDYHNSLFKFLADCDIEIDLQAARKVVSKESIIKRLEQIDVSTIRDSQKVWRKSFHDTVFLDYLNQRMQACPLI